MFGVRSVLNEVAILNIFWSRSCSLVLAFGMSTLYSANLRIGSISYWMSEGENLKAGLWKEWFSSFGYHGRMAGWAGMRIFFSNRSRWSTFKDESLPGICGSNEVGIDFLDEQFLRSICTLIQKGPNVASDKY